MGEARSIVTFNQTSSAVSSITVLLHICHSRCSVKICNRTYANHNINRGGVRVVTTKCHRLSSKLRFKTPRDQANNGKKCSYSNCVHGFKERKQFGIALDTHREVVLDTWRHTRDELYSKLADVTECLGILGSNIALTLRNTTRY